MDPNRVPMTGALSDPCVVCGLRPEFGTCTTGNAHENTDATIHVCYGCGLVQKDVNGVRTPLTPDDLWIFWESDTVNVIMNLAIRRSQNPMETSELVREQMDKIKAERQAKWLHGNPE